jgi:Tfp pilus assembly protein PilF
MQKALLTFLIWPLTLWVSICLPGRADTNQTVLQSDKNAEFELRGEGLLSYGTGTRRVPITLKQDRPRIWAIAETPLSDLEQRLFADAEDGRLDEFSLLDAALIASGVKDTAELGRYSERMESWAVELKHGGGADGSPRRQVEAIFAFLHGKILRGKYNLQCTDLRQAFDDGQFNCVSATVLFNCLAGEMGFSSSALETPGHALSRVFLPDGSLDVETTCPRWFCMEHDRLLNDVEGNGKIPLSSSSGTRRVPTTLEKEAVPFSLHEKRDSPPETIGQKPAKDKAKLREISSIQLTAMIYYNRGIDFLAEKHFAKAAAANAKAIRLDPQSGTARGNFLATINNWAIDLGNAGDYARAVDLLRQGLAFDPHYEAFSLNFAHVHHQWSQELCKDGKYAEAVELLNQAASEMPDNAYFKHAVWDVYRRWAIALFEADKMDEAFAVFAQARRCQGKCREELECELAAVIEYGKELLANYRYEEARQVFDRAMVLQPEASVLHDNRSATGENKGF